MWIKCKCMPHPWSREMCSTSHYIFYSANVIERVYIDAFPQYVALLSSWISDSIHAFKFTTFYVQSYYMLAWARNKKIIMNQRQVECKKKWIGIGSRWLISKLVFCSQIPKYVFRNRFMVRRWGIHQFRFTHSYVLVIKHKYFYPKLIISNIFTCY